MKQILLRSLGYFLFWTIFFLLSRALFLAYQHEHTSALTVSEVFKTFGYGLRMDFSFSAYLSAIPFLLFLLEAGFRKQIFIKLINGFTYVFLTLVSLLVMVDLELYTAWGFRLDSTPLQYLNTPQEMMASAGSAPVLLLFSLCLLLLAVGLVLFNRVKRIWTPTSSLNRKRFPELALSLFLLAFLVLPIRGGWQQIPLNQSDVYFSQKIFANHAGVNVVWNLMHSVIKKNHDTRNPYIYVSEKEAQEMLRELYQPKSDTVPTMLRVKKPNVLFVILESYTAKYLEPLGGPSEVTPNLNRLTKEGILFTNIYASGDRSQKGMVALLSGYPVQPVASIVKTPRKTERLPQLASELKKAGYFTSYYYGGELAFANLRSYLVNGQYDRLLEKSDFPSDFYNSKWGVHDHLLLEKVLQDHQKPREPFLTTVFTLSSHEPYDIPIPARFQGTDEQTQFKNSVYYTDQAVGNFIKEAKKTPWWQNTLVVIVADHGHQFPGPDANHAPGKFRIPLLMIGGALAVKDTVVSSLGAQTDVVPTLLQQMGLPWEHFSWSKNLLDPKTSQFAFYVFNDGFGLVTPQGTVTFDNAARQVIEKDATVTQKQINQGKAYMQTSYADYLKR